MAQKFPKMPTIWQHSTLFDKLACFDLIRVPNSKMNTKPQYFWIICFNQIICPSGGPWWSSGLERQFSRFPSRQEDGPRGPRFESRRCVSFSTSIYLDLFSDGPNFGRYNHIEQPLRETSRMSGSVNWTSQGRWRWRKKEDFDNRKRIQKIDNLSYKA